MSRTAYLIFGTLALAAAGRLLVGWQGGGAPTPARARGNAAEATPANATSVTEKLVPKVDAAHPSGTGRPARAGATAATVPTTQQLTLVKGQAGFWRVARTGDGVWWFISPEGRPEFLNAVTTVQPYQNARDRGGPAFISRDWTGGASDNGDTDAWTKATLERVRGMGFKAIGAWSHQAFHKYDIPITRDLNLWTWMTGIHRLYSPEWSATAERVIQTQTAALRENRNLVGYYIDNELDWGDGAAGPGVYFDGLAADDPNRLEVVSVIKRIWTTVESFNTDWGTALKEYGEVGGMKTLPREPHGAYARLFTAWVSHVAEDYFRMTSGWIRKYDPNHLVLGVRFKGYAPAAVVRASRNYTDAQSINYYVGDGRLDAEMLRMMNRESGQPIIFSEYSFHALDGRSGNRNTVGFAAQVLDQAARAEGYKLFTTRMARVPYIIGADWFQWADEPPSGRGADGEDVNFGMVDIDDRPYQRLAAAVRETTPLLNPLHAGSATDGQKEVWRESFANKPVAHVPFLSKAIALNGELSDWPAEAKLAGIRHSQTIGLERSPMPLPNVYLGWTMEGLYVGLEVFDSDIAGAPAKGWWWTKDNVEFWVSTRPVSSDQDDYDGDCHQFFFVPQDPAANEGIAGAVGQWHRPGDALEGNLIPHEQIRHAERLLADRYVVEMFIPAKAMHGFDPVGQPAMAFNIHARNFQHALDYFWSAPKEVYTQLRPRTWGAMYLEGPAGQVTAHSRGRAPATGPTME